MKKQTKEINFTKMHALGNDFIFLDGLSNALSLTEANIRHLADRRYGIGCDQVLVCEPPQATQSDFFMRIYNLDASESEQCGNGARCFLHYVRQKGFTGKDEIQLQTNGGLVQLRLADTTTSTSASADPKVRCVMGEPDFNPNKVLRNTGVSKVSTTANTSFAKPSSFVLSVPANVNAKDKPAGKNPAVDFEVYPASFGNPHLIIFQQDRGLANKLLEDHGEALATHPQLINGANVGFLSIGKKGLLQLQTYERGSGRTLACGSNASAAYAVAYALGALNPMQGPAVNNIGIELPGGSATMGIVEDEGLDEGLADENNQPRDTQAGPNFQVYMESIVNEVFTGSIVL